MSEGFTVVGDDFVDLDNSVGVVDHLSGRENWLEDKIRGITGEKELQTFDGEKVDVKAKGKTILQGLKLGDAQTSRRLEDRIMDIAKGRDIPERVAKYRGVEQAQAGGSFEVDTDVDDFDDALAALGVTKLRFVPSSSSDTRANTSGSTKEKAKKTAKAGFTLLLPVIALLGLAAYLVGGKK